MTYASNEESATEFIHIYNFPSKKGHEKQTQSWQDLEILMDYLVENPNQVFPFIITEEELETLFKSYSDPLQAVYRALKRNPDLQAKKLGIRAVTKERKRGTNPEIEMIGISRDFWSEGKR
jgi:hypothetical protein